MKILHCISSPKIGGIERLVIELAIAQKQQNIDVAIMLDSTEGQYYSYLQEQNISIYNSGINGGFDFSFKKQKILISTFNNFDIIHLHGFSLLRSMSAKSSKAKVVYTIHGLSKGIRKENKLKYIFRESIKKHYLNKVDFFIANSVYTLKQAQAHYGLNSVSKRAVLNGIRLLDETKNHNIDSSDEFTIGMLSRFTPRKRIDRLVEAFHLFLERGGTGKLIIVGDGDNYEQIVQLVNLKKLSKSVEMPGYTTDVHKYYSKFDVVVHPSDNEGFGLIGVEAYCNGKPIIAFSDSGGLKEVIEPLEPENIVNSEEELADRMLEYEKNKISISESAEKRKQYAHKHFSIERMERDYFEVYKQIADN